jgi:acetyl-CoA carboxylase/biotin carboxylase 1
LSEELILKRMAASAPSAPQSRNGNTGSNPQSPTSSSPSSSSLEATTPSPRQGHLQALCAWTGLLDKEFENNDRKVALWYEENKKLVYSKIEALKADSVAIEVSQLLMGNKEGGLRGVQNVLSMLPVDEKEAVLKYLRAS